MKTILSLWGAYFLGSIPTAYWMIRLKTGQDIRTLGSGNSGATNAFRIGGKAVGLLVLLVDALKGSIAVVLFGSLLRGLLPDPSLERLIAGMAAVLGHVFSPFLKFRGGKGVATAAGVGLAVYPLPLLMTIALWAGLLRITGIMSIASVSAGYVFAILVFLSGAAIVHGFIALLFAAFITWTHRGNISRLFKGQEKKIIS